VRNRPTETALVVNQRGQRLTRQGFWLIMKALVKDSGLADSITPHTLRHTFATHQIGEGVALEQLRQRLGHASIATTQIYCQLADAAPVGGLVVDDSAEGRLVLSDR
jgi:integrase/recombinase XerD